MGQNLFQGVRTSFSSLLSTWEPGNCLETVTVDMRWLGGADSCLHIMEEKSMQNDNAAANSVSRAWETEIKVSKDENSPGNGRPREW